MSMQKTFFSSFDADPFPMQAWYLQHMSQIAGIDEAGRGPLAGPVVAAAVVLSDKTSFLLELNDSKKLTEKKRDLLFHKIQTEALSIGVSVVGIEVIDELNILGATLWGMKEAFDKAQNKYATPILGALIDGNQRAPLDEHIVQHTLIRGDAKCPSIMAASIVAKVTRDRLMKEAALTYSEYGFEKHKGYGTKYHMQALEEYGPCPLHRRSFAPVRNALKQERKKPSPQEPSTTDVGLQGEILAERYLHRKGFRIVEKRFRALRGEIDIVGYDQDVLCFVEVKFQKERNFKPAHHQVHQRKQRHLIRAAQAYMKKNHAKQKPACRFDVVAIEGLGKSKTVQWYRDAFREEES